MDKLIIGYLESVIVLLMGQFSSGASDLFSCRFEGSNTCSISSTAWITETGRDWENNEQGAYYVTNRHTEYGIKNFPLPSLWAPSSSSTTARLSFYFKFYGHTKCSILVYIGWAVKFKQARSNSMDYSWRKAPNIDFNCCCSRCPSITFQAACKFGTGGVAVDDIIVSAIKTNRPQTRLAVTPSRKTVTTSVQKQATTPTTKVQTTLRPITTKGSSTSTYGRTTSDSPSTLTSALEMSTMSTLVGECTSRNTSSDSEISFEVSNDPENNNTKSESVNPTIPSAGKWPLSRGELKIVLPVLLIMIIGIVTVSVVMLNVKMRRGKQRSNNVNAARSCDAECQGSDKLEGGYVDPRQLDIKLEILNHECSGHHYIPMNPIRPMNQPTDADEVPFATYENNFHHTEKSKGSQIYENEYVNSERPHLYANCLLSDFADTAEVMEDVGYVGCSRGQKQDVCTPCPADAFNEDSALSHDQCMKEEVHSRPCNHPNPTYTPYDPV